jgi:predicted RNA-binding Zn ribbon-like protein
VPARPRVTRALLGETRDLREAIDACMGATLAGTSAPRPAAREIDRWLVDVRPRLERDAAGALVLAEHPPVDSARAALASIALDAARMLGTPAEAARIRVCASQTCSARFYDRSPAGRRRWCSMALCGNEAKARRHRARAKRAAAGGDRASGRPGAASGRSAAA